MRVPLIEIGWLAVSLNTHLFDMGALAVAVKPQDCTLIINYFHLVPIDVDLIKVVQVTTLATSISLIKQGLTVAVLW